MSMLPQGPVVYLTDSLVLSLRQTETVWVIDMDPPGRRWLRPSRCGSGLDSGDTPLALCHLAAVVLVSPTCAASSWSSNSGLLSSGTKPPAATTGGGCCGESMANTHVLRDGLHCCDVVMQPRAAVKMQPAGAAALRAGDGTREESDRDALEPTWRSTHARCRMSSCVCANNTNRCVCV